MKIKVRTTPKTFDTVKTFRKIKEQVAKEVAGMTFEQLKDYLHENSRKLQEL
jgi:hypothetical protein